MPESLWRRQGQCVGLASKSMGAVCPSDPLAHEETACCRQLPCPEMCQTSQRRAALKSPPSHDHRIWSSHTYEVGASFVLAAGTLRISAIKCSCLLKRQGSGLSKMKSASRVICSQAAAGGGQGPIAWKRDVGSPACLFPGSCGPLPCDQPEWLQFVFLGGEAASWQPSGPHALSLPSMHFP